MLKRPTVGALTKQLRKRSLLSRTSGWIRWAGALVDLPALTAGESTSGSGLGSAATSGVRESHLHVTRTVYTVTGSTDALWRALSRVEGKVWSRRTAFGGRRVQVAAESGYDYTFTAAPSKGRVANHFCEWLGLLVTRVDRREGWGSSAARESPQVSITNSWVRNRSRS